jgi:hypothetical protein
LNKNISFPLLPGPAQKKQLAQFKSWLQDGAVGRFPFEQMWQCQIKPLPARFEY